MKKQELGSIQNSIFNKEIVSLKTTLKDTLIVNENSVVFLRPDSFRFQYYVIAEEPGIFEADSDFGFGINATMDSIDKNKLKIKYLICDKRFIKINNSIQGLKIIDRDTIDYGAILVSKKKGIKSCYFISSLGYFDMINEYFDLN